jgi:hypothetical protein
MDTGGREKQDARAESHEGPGIALHRWAASGRALGAMMERGPRRGRAGCKGQDFLLTFGGAVHPEAGQKWG